jgi:prevent-host-death family protein
MITVGVRELKQQASELIRLVRESGSRVQVTYHGKVVAMLVPVPPVPDADTDESQVWDPLNALAAEIGALWPDGVTASQAVAEARR